MKTYRRTATSTNSIYFTNYLEAVLCSYLKEKKMHNDKRIQFYDTNFLDDNERGFIRKNVFQY